MYFYLYLYKYFYLYLYIGVAGELCPPPLYRPRARLRGRMPSLPSPEVMSEPPSRPHQGRAGLRDRLPLPQTFKQYKEARQGRGVGRVALLFKQYCQMEVDRLS